MRIRFRYALPLCFLAGLLYLLASPFAMSQICPSGANNLCVTTWQQDSGTDVGAGYAYRTGENLLESTITSSTIQNNSFGQLCSSDSANSNPLDGQIYAQPLVLTNVTINQQNYSYNMVYVVTQNDTLYAIDGKNCVVRYQYSFLQHTPMIGQSPVNCTKFANQPCGTIYPTVGILGTPVIDKSAGTIYLVTQSIDSSGNFYHYLHALDVQTFTEKSNGPVLICPPLESCPSSSGFSFYHIQRPGLLLANCGSSCGSKNYVYVAFSMMDGAGTPYPNGAIFAYDASDFSIGRQAYFQTALERNDTSNGGGIWMGGAALAFGPDGQGSNWLYFTTANGTFDLSNGGSNAGDSFIKLDPATLTVPSSNGYFAPADQRYRSDPTCGAPQPGDMDFGSGGVLLIPDNELSYPHYGYLALNGEKEGNLWFIRRDVPGGFGGSLTVCSTGVNHNVQTYAVQPTNVIHNNLAYWESESHLFPDKPYVYVAPENINYLYQFELCTGTSDANPICGSSYSGRATLAHGTNITSDGITPTISAVSSTASDAIVWVIQKTDGSYAESDKNPIGNNHTGAFFAFDATSMAQLYPTANPCAGDAINQATKFSVPTIANGYVYLGTQSANTTQQNKGLGTLYIFGLNRTCQP